MAAKHTPVLPVSKGPASAVDYYINAIRENAEYAVDFDQSTTQSYRASLWQLAATVQSGNPEALQGSRPVLRSLLRDYRDSASRYLARLRDDLTATATALQETIGALVHSDDDHSTRLRGTVQHLRSLSSDPVLSASAPAIVATAEEIEQTLESLQTQHQFAVAQFRAEVRLLHRRIEALETAVKTDDLTKLYNRTEMEHRIAAAPPGQHCLLALQTEGLRRAEAQYGREVLSELARAFTRRLRNGLPQGVAIGRWSDNGFVAILLVDQDKARPYEKWAEERLSGFYVCRRETRNVLPTLMVRAQVIESSPGETADETCARLTAFLVDE